MSGIMNPQPKQDALLEQFRRALGPATAAPATLEQRLKGLSETELSTVKTITQMVKMIASMQSGQQQSYQQIIDSSYPLMNAKLKAVVVELLQDADPRPVTMPEAKQEAVDAREALLQNYYAVLGEADLEKATPQAQTASAANAVEPPLQASLGAKTQGNSAFLDKLILSESSGRSDAEITIADGRRYVGFLQFGAARLADYKSATGQKFTQDEFKADPALQDEVAQWHFQDIDKAIDALGDAAKGYDRNGLRSVAHLGGKGGMKKFVQSGGQYNPADELGTSLQDYYDKHSSGGGA